MQKKNQVKEKNKYKDISANKYSLTKSTEIQIYNGKRNKKTDNFPFINEQMPLFKHLSTFGEQESFPKNIQKINNPKINLSDFNEFMNISENYIPKNTQKINNQKINLSDFNEFMNTSENYIPKNTLVYPSQLMRLNRKKALEILKDSEELFRDFNKFDFSGVDFGDILKTFNECKDIFNSIDFKLTLEDFKKTLKTISIVLILVEIAKGSISARIPFSYIFKSYPTLFSTAFPGMTISSASAMFSTFLASNVSFPTALVSVTLYNFLVCGIIPVSCVCICAALIIENKDSFYRMAAFLGKTYDIFSKIYNNENLRKIFDTVWDNKSTFKKVYDCEIKLKILLKKVEKVKKKKKKRN